MARDKSIEQKYRFKMIPNVLTKNGEYHVFESRYYAEKFLKEQVLYSDVQFKVFEGEEYSVEKVFDGFVIVKSVKSVI